MLLQIPERDPNERRKKLKRMTVRMAGEEKETERRKNLVVAVPAGVEEHLLLPVLLGVQDVVAARPSTIS